MGLLFWTAVTSKGVLAFSLFYRKLARRYPWFAAYILASLLTELPMLWLRHHSLAYTYYWMAVEPPLWILKALLVFEAYVELTRFYPFFGRDCSKMFFSTLSAAAILSLVLLPIEIPHVASAQAIVTTYTLMLVAKRFITLMAALFIGQTISFFFRYPLSVPRNLAAHGVMLAAYFAFDAGTCFASLMKGTPWATAYILPASFVLILAWPFIYKRGADAPRKVELTEEDLRLIEQGPELRAKISEIEWSLRRR